MTGPAIPTLTTGRLVLRAFRAADLDAYAALRADPEVTRYITGASGWTREESARHLAAVMGHWSLYGFGLWAVERRDDQALIGIAGAFDYMQGGQPELGWAFARAHWGQGFATEAMGAVLEHCFTVWDMPRLEAAIQPGNLASIRLAERLGFRPGRETIKREHAVRIYARLRD